MAPAPTPHASDSSGHPPTGDGGAHAHPHEPMLHHEERKHGELRELVFGLEDGLVSTLGVITGIAAGTGSRLVVILSGLVVIFVESLSMGAGSYLSNKSEAELEARLLDEELHEIRNHPQKERRELHEFYAARGFTHAERQPMIERLMADEDLLLEEMAHKELGIIPGREAHPVRKGIIMWAAYMAGGIIPIVPYLLLATTSPALPFSVGATLLALFGLGYAKGRMVRISPLKSGIEMVLVAGAAAGIGYAVGKVAGHLLGIEV